MVGSLYVTDVHTWFENCVTRDERSKLLMAKKYGGGAGDAHDSMAAFDDASRSGPTPIMYMSIPSVYACCAMAAGL